MSRKYLILQKEKSFDVCWSFTAVVGGRETTLITSDPQKESLSGAEKTRKEAECKISAENNDHITQTKLLQSS
jgi:hypothetical protein